MFQPSKSPLPRLKRITASAARALRAGYTLAEIMVASFVATIAFTLITTLTVQSAEIMFTSQHKLGIKADGR